MMKTNKPPKAHYAVITFHGLSSLSKQERKKVSRWLDMLSARVKDDDLSQYADTYRCRIER